LVIKSYELY